MVGCIWDRENNLYFQRINNWHTYSSNVLPILSISPFIHYISCLFTDNSTDNNYGDKQLCVHNSCLGNLQRSFNKKESHGKTDNQYHMVWMIQQYETTTIIM